MKKWLSFASVILTCFFSLLLPRSIFAGDLANSEVVDGGDKVVINLFWAETCPHCHKAMDFIENLAEKNPRIVFRDFEISDRSNAQIMQKVDSRLKINSNGVPLIVIGDKYIVGYLNDETQGKEIVDNANFCLETNNCPDMVKEVFLDDLLSIKKKTTQNNIPETETKPINLPVFGEIHPENYSLIALTMMIAFLDGFNPCAMWVLVFLITLLLKIESVKRRWILGIAFISASGFVYFLFLSAWLNFFLFIGFISWVRIIIGLVAIYAGYYNLKDFFSNPNAECKVTHSEGKQKVFSKLKEIVQKQNLWLALTGIVMLAFAVNLVELVCSAGLPAIYTQIIALKNLAIWQYYAYLLLYIIIFMLDDLLVFFIAMKTLQLSGLNNKYARFSRLIGGIIILLLGIFLIFRPELITGG